jgi:hypothetical protein
MKVATGTVVDGRVEVPEEFAAEGLRVVILAPESREGVTLTQEEEQALLEAAEAIGRGDFVDGHQLLEELRSLRA